MTDVKTGKAKDGQVRCCLFVVICLFVCVFFFGKGGGGMKKGRIDNGTERLGI